MTEFTIIKLKRAIEETPYVWRLSLSEVKSIIKEVEKGLKKPLLLKRKISVFNTLYVCPNCKKTGYTTNSEYEYPLRCSQCGQRFSWKDFLKKQKEENKILNEKTMELTKQLKGVGE